MIAPSTPAPRSAADPSRPPANRIDAAFQRLRAEGEAALVTFVTAGDPWPTAEGTARLIVALAGAGADVVELGLPYSDPQADGPSIQAASQRALERGVNTPLAWEAVRLAREATAVPIVLMTYYNPVYRYGLERFAADGAAAGIDGVILTDLPPEEARPWLAAASAQGLATTFLLAPTSTPERIALVARHMDSGFVYCVSRTGVTGARRDLPPELAQLIARIQAATPLPVCVGFGINTAAHVATVSAVADGAVIGSALVDYLHAHAAEPGALTDAAAMVAGWKAATRRK